MPTLSSLALPPPRNWQDFENLCCDLWSRLWSDPETQKNGRAGQPQAGVDIFGRPDRGLEWAGVQCKLRTRLEGLTRRDLEQEVKKARNFKPSLGRFSIATTAATDVAIQKTARKISAAQLKAGGFSVSVASWDDIRLQLASYPDLVAKHFPDLISSHNVIVQISGDGNSVVVGSAYLTLTRYLNRRITKEAPWSEAALLSPYALSVPLVGRETVLEDLWDWIGTSHPISVRVITAKPGGGKTRLALELCNQAAQIGWDAGFLTEAELVRFRSSQNLATWGWKRPTLIVLDYAASQVKHLRDWLVELADHPGQEGKPLRVLLLERHADPSGGWWREVFGHGGGDSEAVGRLLDPASEPYIVPPLIGPLERQAVLVSILERIGSRVRPPEAGTSPSFERQLAEISWGGEPLFLLMAGLIANRAGFGAILALSATDLGLQLAGHELERIRRIARSRKIQESFFAHLAAYITLCQGLSREEVETVVEEEKEALRYISAGDPPTIYEALAVAFPGEQGSIAPILPDVIGEAVVLEALGGGSSEKQKACNAVARAAQRAAKKVTASLIHLAQDYGAVRPEPLTWFEEVVGTAAISLESLEAVLAQLPHYTLTLRKPAEKLTRMAVDLARQEGQLERQAWHLHNLAHRLSDLGMLKEALTASDEAVAIIRVITTSYPDALASSLNRLFNRLREMNKSQEALAAIEESSALYRELASSSPEIYGHHLAMSLSNMALGLEALDRNEEALATNAEALRRYRELEASRPGVFSADLATSLTCLSLCLSKLGRKEEALAASEEVVARYRELAASHPDAFLPDLARSLRQLSLDLGSLGRSEEALVMNADAVEFYRKFAVRHPDTFRTDLATSLYVQSLILSDLGRDDNALAANTEAAALFREVAVRQPDTPRASLARSLNNLAVLLNNLSRKDEALAAGAEAVAIYRNLAILQPEPFKTSLANSLRNQAVFLSELNRGEEALSVNAEAVALYRGLAVQQPELFQAKLAESLHNFAVMLSDLSRKEAALAAIEEAVALYGGLAISQPETFLPDLANSLYNLSYGLSELGRKAMAMEASHEAIRILSPFFLTDSAAFEESIDDMVRRYVLFAHGANQEPDSKFLRPILDRLAELATEPEPADKPI